MPTSDLLKCVYLPPIIVYHLNIFSTGILINDFTSDLHEDLRQILVAISRHEKITPFAFKSRIFILEILDAKKIDAKAILGEELTSLMPIDVPPDDLTTNQYASLIQATMRDPLFALKTQKSLAQPESANIKFERPQDTIGTPVSTVSDSNAPFCYIGDHTDVTKGLFLDSLLNDLFKPC
jgi:hypothetical protein